MKRDNCYMTLATMLKAAGQSPDALDLEKVWEVFIAFCEIPITDAESDGIIVEWGPQRAPTSREVIGFYFSVLRQWNDDYEEFWQLRLKWFYPICEYTKNIESGNSWWRFVTDGQDMPQLLREQRDSELFQYLKTRTPIKTEMYQDNTG